MTKKHLPNFFLFGLVILFIGAFFAVKFLPDFVEKHSFKPPPPFKKLTEAESKPATDSGKIKYPHDYTLVILGDSMTETFGNSDEIKGYLNGYYPDKTFEVLNYGYGSTSIKSAKERLTQITHYGERDFVPILDIDFDYLLIESFGHNPLSEYKEDSLKKQTEILDDLVELVATTSGKEKLIFVGTIGANKQTYAKAIEPQLEPKVRQQWAEERNSSIKNHLTYARTHQIPYIDAFTPSLDIYGNTKQYLIRTSDNIHPSPSGVLFISKKIADFLIKNNFIK